MGLSGQGYPIQSSPLSREEFGVPGRAGPARIFVSAVLNLLQRDCLSPQFSKAANTLGFILILLYHCLYISQTQARSLLMAEASLSSYSCPWLCGPDAKAERGLCGRGLLLIVCTPLAALLNFYQILLAFFAPSKPFLSLC